MANIHDVAKRADVSVKTVSRYLSGYQGISRKTVERIEKAAEELEFFPSAAARSLRGQPSGILCLIADNLTTTPFSFDIVKGVQSVCEIHGKLLLIGETRESPHIFAQLIRRFRQQKVEAIIKATFYHKQIEITQKFEHCPLVLVNCFDEAGRFSSVVPDDEQGAYDLTKRLITLGHRDIANITLPEDMIATRLRQQGFVRAMQESAIPLNAEWIIHAERKEPAETSTWLHALLERLLAGRKRPTAIMCGNDKMALRVIMHLHAMNISIPDDISVVGYDDYTLISENTVPPLTTASLPYYQMGVRAAELAFDMMANGARVSGVEKCRCDVVPRESDKALQQPDGRGSAQEEDMAIIQ
ncbi:LacI family transcriptional regulator [Sphingomonas oleivorans]|uniref:LacI family transcriptional regulator n=1 Tax=Sphingomonas oleivorans TaxID=1735121 RepID=A0A2T5FTQ8_9SPHN|nr:LacI family DNA-binding transcriptional regulator [Sphingomonas oleivorans]PTQ07457.1 LacI family transcriptional regulator [Sphingomonas oleivorans]